ncbi:MAG: hypothetical protein CM1200mP3_16530 [Chloroflexota bacterium]|nr:MAG: hypothetical protein CM1200mP3_16530 [Chloroflexota bacterium]
MPCSVGDSEISLVIDGRSIPIVFAMRNPAVLQVIKTE